MHYLTNIIAFCNEQMKIEIENIGQWLHISPFHQILRIQRELARKGQEDKTCSYFDTGRAIFICNKWDQIPDDEEPDEIFQIISNKLKENWYGFNPEKLFKLSVSKVSYCFASIMHIYIVMNLECLNVRIGLSIVFFAPQASIVHLKISWFSKNGLGVLL